MRSLITFFVRRPAWANAMIALTVIFGIWSAMNMRRSFFPETEVRRIVITTVYPGASPSEIDEGITVLITDALSGIKGIEDSQGRSEENLSTVTVTGEEGVDMDELLSDVENAVNSITNWPAGAEPARIRRIKSFGIASRVAWMVVSAKNQDSTASEEDLEDLRQEAEKIERDLLLTRVITEVEIQGLPENEFRVELSKEQMLRYDITFQEVSNAIRMKNLDLTGGKIESDVEELIVRSMQRSTKPEDLEQIVVRTSPDGAVIRVKDVAKVVYGFAEEQFKSFINGDRGVTIQISKTPEQDITEITDEIDRYVEEYNAKNDDKQLKILFQFNEMLQDRITMLRNNGLLGLILVLLMLGFFLNLRLSAWVAFGIPFSFLGMMIIGNGIDITINMISLFGMILVVGILVDDGIVIAENIYSHYEKGKTPIKAAIDGTMEVIGSVFTSVLTTIIAFGFLFYVERMEMMQEMVIVVILCLAFSLIEAFFILPSHLASKKVLSEAPKGSFNHKVREFFDRIMTFLRTVMFRPIVELMTKKYRFTAFIPLIFIVVTGIFMGLKLIKATIFPDIKPDRFTMEVAFKPGEPELRTMAYLHELENILKEEDQRIKDETGEGLYSYYTMNIGGTEQLGQNGMNTGMLSVFVDAEGKETPVDTLMQRCLRRMRALDETKLAVDIYVGGGGNRFGKPLEYSLSSVDEEELLQAVSFLKGELRANEYTKNVKDNYPLGKKDVLLTLRPEAERLGMSSAEIYRQIREAFFGAEAQRVIIGTNEVKVWVKYPKADRKGLESLENMRVVTPTGSRILLSEVMDIAIERGPVGISRLNGKRNILVDADVTDADKTGDVTLDMNQGALAEMETLFPNVDVEIRGQQMEAQKTGGSMAILTLVMLFVMWLVISMNFSSMSQGLIVIAVIPSGVAGALWGHGIVGIPVSMLSLFGVIALIGVMVNDAVVFIDRYNRNVLEGMHVREAAVEASQARFRPILLTSVTTVAGLMPLIAEQSFQAQFLIPMAVSIAFGILIGTIFILTFLPALILLANDARRAIFSGFDRENFMPVSVVYTYLSIPLMLLFGMFGLGFLLPKVWRGSMKKVRTPEEVEPAIRLNKEYKERDAMLEE